MKEIDGYVYVAAFKSAVGKFMYGPDTKKGTDNPDSFKHNGMTPFKSQKEILTAARKIRQRPDFARGAIYHLQMTVAETEDEHAEIEKLRGLVVIIFGKYGVELLGRSTADGMKMGYIPGSLLETNGFKPFSGYIDALYAAREANRQAASPTMISTFKMTRVVKK